MPYGSAIHVPTYALSRDPEYWGANADSFDLTRFLPENKDKLVPGAYMSFGGGPRICPGIRMSQFMLKRMIAPVLQRFSLEHPGTSSFPSTRARLPTPLLASASASVRDPQSCLADGPFEEKRGTCVSLFT